MMKILMILCKWLQKSKEKLENESPAGQSGRTIGDDAIEFILKNPNKINEIKKLSNNPAAKQYLWKLLKLFYLQTLMTKLFNLKIMI